MGKPKTAGVSQRFQHPGPDQRCPEEDGGGLSYVKHRDSGVPLLPSQGGLQVSISLVMLCSIGVHGS